MCKLFILSDTSKLTRPQLSKMLKAAASQMGKTDDDGFGWAMLNGNKVVGERCLDPEYFENRFFNNGTVPSEFKPIFEDWEAQSFGKLPQVFSGGLLVHARISTNEVGLHNTHPFINDNYALVHNGIVYNEGEHYEQKSTCDTEHILQHLTTHGVAGMVERVSGYYAVGALNKNTGELLVIKDATANLNACFVPSLSAMAFGTNGDQLHEILKAAGLVHTKIKSVKDNVALTFGRDGKLLSCVEITPLERASKWDNKDYYRSMGWDYTDESGLAASNCRRNVVPMSQSEVDVPSDIARIRAYDDGAPVVDSRSQYVEFDFMFDDQGERIPNYLLDKYYIITDADNKVITAEEFATLDDVEASYCDVIERESGEFVGRKAS